MKKLVIMLLCVALAVGLAACGSDGSTGENYFTDVETGKKVALGMTEAEVSAVLGEGDYDEEIDEYTYRDGAVSVEFADDAAIYIYVMDDGANYKIGGFKPGTTEEEVVKVYDDVFDFSEFGDIFTEISYSAYYGADNKKVAADDENVAYMVSVRYDGGVYTGFDIADLTWGGDTLYEEGDGEYAGEEGDADYYVDEEGNIVDAEGNVVDFGDESGVEWEEEPT